MLVLTDLDVKRLKDFVEKALALPNLPEHTHRVCEMLREMMDQAAVVPSSEMPADVITLDTTLVIRDQRGGSRTVQMVLPENPAKLLPIVAAALGRRIGDEVECACEHGPCFILEHMRYQPETAAAGKSARPQRRE